MAKQRWNRYCDWSDRRVETAIKPEKQIQETSVWVSWQTNVCERPSTREKQSSSWREKWDGKYLLLPKCAYVGGIDMSYENGTVFAGFSRDSAWLMRQGLPLQRQTVQRGP